MVRECLPGADGVRRKRRSHVRPRLSRHRHRSEGGVQRKAREPDREVRDAGPQLGAWTGRRVGVCPGRNEEPGVHAGVRHPSGAPYRAGRARPRRPDLRVVPRPRLQTDQGAGPGSSQAPRRVPAWRRVCERRGSLRRAAPSPTPWAYDPPGGTSDERAARQRPCHAVRPAPGAPAELLAQLGADHRAAQWVPAFEREWAAALVESRRTICLSGLYQVLQDWQGRLASASAVDAFAPPATTTSSRPHPQRNLEMINAEKMAGHAGL
ncbi:DUF6247 family protein [Streptomyces sp. NPDC101206]|uniref:DUF6247 family protein n=1 Tax=Streptomyces sp. NPDC101206 TaxID=3366128 RepID=UPI0037F83D34